MEDTVTTECTVSKYSSWMCRVHIDMQPPNPLSLHGCVCWQQGFSDLILLWEEEEMRMYIQSHSNLIYKRFSFSFSAAAWTQTGRYVKDRWVLIIWGKIMATWTHRPKPVSLEHKDNPSSGAFCIWTSYKNIWYRQDLVTMEIKKIRKHKVSQTP